MTQKQINKPVIIQAKADLVSEIYELIHRTIEEIYTKYYSDEAVRFFLEFHSEENILKDISDGKVYAVTLGQDVIATGRSGYVFGSQIPFLPRNRNICDIGFRFR